MDKDLYTLAGGALLLGFLHALIPNHWIPFVAMGRNRGWGTGRTALVTLLGGTTHMASTILVGVAVGLLGLAVTSWYEAIMRWGAPAILAVAGLWVFACGHGSHGKHLGSLGSHAHEHSHEAKGEPHSHDAERLNVRDLATVGTLCAMMFLSPCLEMEAYYVVAARKGWAGIALVSVVYLLITTAAMVGVVAIASKGLERVRWRFLEQYENKLIGGALILLSAFWLAFAH